MPDNQPAQGPEEIKEDPKEINENPISDYYDGVKKMEREGYESGIKKARNALFATAVLVFLAEMLGARLQNIEITPFLIGFALVEAGVFVGLAFWTKTKPYTAIIIGLILFIGLWIFTIVVVGTDAIYKGILVKIIIISYLAKALKDAKAWEDAKKS